jgi:predicted FMN-binding regulatory protein PaiB
MYLPEHFKVTDLAKISELITAYPLATLINVSAAGLPLADQQGVIDALTLSGQAAALELACLMKSNLSI